MRDAVGARAIAAWSAEWQPGRLAWLRAAPIALAIAAQMWLGDPLAAVLIAATLCAGFLVVRFAGGSVGTRDQGTTPAAVEARNDCIVAQLIGCTLLAAVLALWLYGDIRAFSSVLLVVATYGISPGTRLALIAASVRRRRPSPSLDAAALERLWAVESVVFDLPAIVTSDQLCVERVFPAAGASVRDVMRCAAATMSDSDDPVALALADYARQIGVRLDMPVRVLTRTPHSTSALVGDDEVVVGDAVLLRDIAPSTPAPSPTGATATFVMRGAHYLGLIALGQRVRPDVKRAIGELRDMRITTRLITTKQAEAVEPVARDVAIDRRAAGLTDTLYAELWRAARATPTVAAIDDAVTAGDTARGAVIAHDLCELARAIAWARRTRRVIRQNVVGTLLLDTVGIALASAGVLVPVAAAAVHAVCDVACIGNVSRLFSKS